MQSLSPEEVQILCKMIRENQMSEDIMNLIKELAEQNKNAILHA